MTSTSWRHRFVDLRAEIADVARDLLVESTMKTAENEALKVWNF
jgi:hypothetical protein